MPKKRGSKPETKSDFLRRILDKDPDLDLQQVNRRWAGAGHAGEISNALYYKVRGELGIRTEWAWVQEEATGTRPPDDGGTGVVYQFRITLVDSKPPIWRRIRVADGTLDDLHEQIQTAMGWTNSHLHHFRIGEKLYGDPMLMQENFEQFDYGDSTKVLLSEILPESGKWFRFKYEYDFGDSWKHQVLFEDSIPAEPGKRYPACVDGARACPPEDVGGVWGYAILLAAIADPTDERHEEMRGRVGRKFDPERFDPAAATRRMRAGLPDWR